MDHSYEEIRSVVLDILAGRERVEYQPVQYSHLRIGVAEVLQRGEARHHEPVSSQPRLSSADAETLREVFWALFRDGTITMGLNEDNPQYPWFKVSEFGKRLLNQGPPYPFHDVSTYIQLVKDNIPPIDPVSLVYLQEAMQAFKAGCILSATVMLGVATEHTFLLVLDAVESNPELRVQFRTVFGKRTLLQKVNKYKHILDQHLKDYPRHIQEDLDTNFTGILSIIRTFRNQSGHPTGKIIDREQAYVLLQLFVPYCRKMYELISFYQGEV